MSGHRTGPAADGPARPSRPVAAAPATALPGKPIDVLAAVGEELLRAVPADIWCAVMLDPATLLDTGGLHEHGFPVAVMPRLFEIEHGTQDSPDHIRALAARPGATSLLSRSARGAHRDGVYHRDVLAPAGLDDELRVVLKADGHTWGLFCLCRGPRSRPFSADDLRRAEAVSATAATRLRRALLLSGVDSDRAPDAPGLVTADRDGRMLSANAAASHWLAGLAEDHGAGRPPGPYALSALLQQIRHAPDGVTASARARVRGGQWITLTAWRQGPPGEELSYVELAPSRPGELAALVLDHYGLTRRERDVTQHVLHSRSSAEIAAALHISEYTVQDHLRKVFDKLGVRSRREITGTLFLRHYLPALPGPPLSTDGRLVDGAPAPAPASPPHPASPPAPASAPAPAPPAAAAEIA